MRDMLGLPKEQGSMEQYKISVIMPALNEEQCLHGGVVNVLEGFQRYAINGELIIVNDGSTDRTGALAEVWAAKYSFIRVLHHTTRQGIGASYWDGIQQAQGEIVVYIPGDGENDAAEIFRYIPLMDQVDVIVPFVLNPGIRNWRRRLLSFIYHKIMHATSSLALNYMNGNVLYRKAILTGIALKSRGFFFQPELLLKTVGRGYLYAEVPCVQKKRLGGSSKSISIRSLIEVCRAYCVTMYDVYFSNRTDIAMVSASVTARRLQEFKVYTGGLKI